MNKTPEIMFHLVGEQSIPIFLAILQFPKEVRHYLLTTDSGKTKKTVSALLKTLAARGFYGESLSLGAEEDATSFAAMNKKITEIYGKVNAQGHPSAFNITGGTKPMSISAVIAARSFPVQPDIFYLNFYSREISWLNGEMQPLTERMSLEDFVLLAGLQLKKQEESLPAPSSKFLNFLFNNAHILQSCQGNFATLADTYSKKPGKKKKALPAGMSPDQYGKSCFDHLEEGFRKKKNLPIFQKHFQDYKAQAPGGNLSTSQLARFFAGIWFEYFICEQLKGCDGIRELLHSAEFVGDDNAVRQEIDIAYTDGYSLFILECKAGRITQEHIQKLENLRNVYSGAMGRGGLVYLDSTQLKTAQTRVKDSRNIAAFCNINGLNALKNNLFNFKPGEINT